MWTELPRKARSAGAQRVDGQEGTRGELQARESQEQTQEVDGEAGLKQGRRGRPGGARERAQGRAGPPYPGRKPL